jgi:hypothetical protein
MNANRFSSSTFAVLTTFLLSAATLQAQTFTGQQTSTETPATFEAVVYPLSNVPATLKVIFNNPTGGLVRVQVRNKEGEVFYDSYETERQYRRRFDLSLLPHGDYTVQLSKKKENYLQSFAIVPPVQAQSQIALTNPWYQKTLKKPLHKKLIVSQ